MKKIIALVLAAMMLLACCSFASAEAPEGYPEVIEGLDFGGETVYIYDWWSSGERTAEPDEDTQKTYDYRDWLEATYNVKLVEVALSDWAGNPTELANMVMNADASKLCVIAVANDFAGSTLANNQYAPWAIEVGDQFNAAAVDFMTKDGVVYGVGIGANEPRSCIFFNKRVLTEAGIDPESIYDMQADGTWTWEAFEEMLKATTRDIDNDGVNDIYGLTGSGDDYCQGLVFANGASFFDFVDGKLTATIGSDAGLQALQFRIDTWNTYAAPTPDGANWDWFKDFWKQGTSAFYAGQTWQGFNDGSEMADMEDEWGAVMFPKGPAAEDYMAYVCPNIYGVPAVYDEETTKKIQQIFSLYELPTPGVDDEDGWIGNKYNYTDERAVDETYAMMRGNDHACGNKTFLLGSANDTIGGNLMWALGNGTPAEIVEAAMPAWNDKCAVFNGDMSQEELDAKNAAAEEAPVE